MDGDDRRQSGSAQRHADQRHGQHRHPERHERLHRSHDGLRRHVGAWARRRRPGAHRRRGRYPGRQDRLRLLRRLYARDDDPVGSYRELQQRRRGLRLRAPTQFDRAHRRHPRDRLGLGRRHRQSQADRRPREYGDANLDGLVDGTDFNAVLSSYGDQSGDTSWATGDFNYDGAVSGYEFNVVLSNYGAFPTDLPPKAISITPLAASPAGADSVQFVVAFGEEVAGVTAADFLVTGGTGAIASIVGYGPDAEKAVYLVTVDHVFNAFGTGTVGLSLLDQYQSPGSLIEDDDLNLLAGDGDIGTFSRYCVAFAMRSSDPNARKYETVTTTPEYNTETVYRNLSGQILVDDFHDIDDPANPALDGTHSITCYKYNSDGELVEKDEPSAVSTYGFDGYGVLVVTPNEYSGLIELTDYYPANPTTPATETTAGGIEGYFYQSYIQVGSLGTPVLQETRDYYQVQGTVVVADDTVYSDTAGLEAATTSYTYTWVSGTGTVQSATACCRRLRTSRPAMGPTI